MRPVDMQPVGSELAIKWDDGTETFVRLEALRRACPCAGCKGEVDIMGNLYKNPDKPYTTGAFQITRLGLVGGYGVQPVASQQPQLPQQLMRIQTWQLL